MKKSLAPYDRALVANLRVDAAAIAASSDWKPTQTLATLLERPTAELGSEDVLLMEKLFYLTIPTGVLINRLPSLRTDLDLIGEQRFSELYGTVVHTVPSGKEPEESVVRADADALLFMLQRARALGSARESIRNKVSLALSIVLASFLILVIMYVAWAAAGAYVGGATASQLDRGSIIVLVVIAGAMGGMFSVQHRLQAIPERGMAAFGHFTVLRISAGICFALATGAAAAFVLFLLFAAGLLQGSLFPKIDCFIISTRKLSEWPGVDYFLAVTGPASVPDAGKLLVWSFLAGFSEKFVPDQLFLLVSAINKQERKSGVKAQARE